MERRTGVDHRKHLLQVLEEGLAHLLHELELLLLDNLVSLEDLQAVARQQHPVTGIFFFREDVTTGPSLPI